MTTRTLPDALRAAGFDCTECPDGAHPFDVPTVTISPYEAFPHDKLPARIASRNAWWHHAPPYREPQPPAPKHGHLGDQLFLNVSFIEALLTPLDTEMLKVEYQERYDSDGRRPANIWLRELVWGDQR